MQQLSIWKKREKKKKNKNHRKSIRILNIIQPNALIFQIRKLTLRENMTCTRSFTQLINAAAKNSYQVSQLPIQCSFYYSSIPKGNGLPFPCVSLNNTHRSWQGTVTQLQCENHLFSERTSHSTLKSSILKVSL